MVQCHPQLQSEYRASLDCVRLSQKREEEEAVGWLHR